MLDEFIHQPRVAYFTMEIALRKAMGEAPAPTAAPVKAAAPPKSRQVQEDLLARTLEQRAKTSAGK